MQAEELRRRFSVVSQQAHLFTATIADNLRVARPGATAADLEDACRIAQIHDFIAAQPDGYQTYVGTNGLKLSGGQARRLVVARALLKDAPVLVLDEPTEGMDGETELALLDAVMTARSGRAVLMITHRPVLLERMNDIVRIENGRIAGRSTQ
jgi:ATP-binding cassette subfamily C protein CydC